MSAGPQTRTPSVAHPAKIGRHEILGRVAQGGMAELFLGRIVEPAGVRVVAVKRVLPHLANDREFVNMFLDEANLSSRLDHPNIARVEELGNDAGNLFLTMEYLCGESANDVLKAIVTTEEVLSPAVVAYVIAETCAGLSHAHQLADDTGRPLFLVHRDISPANIFFTFDGSVKVLDFGIASAEGRLTETRVGQVKGKAAYMSPEHVRAELLDARSDLFSLGIVMWELAMKSRLFKRKNEIETSKAVLVDPAPRLDEVRPGFPFALAEICARALTKERDGRYVSAEEMREDLVAALPADGNPAAELAALLDKLFSERKAEKIALLRNAAGLDDVVVSGLSPRNDQSLDSFDIDIALPASGPAVLLTPTSAVRHATYIVVGLIGVTLLGILLGVVLR